MMGEVIHRQQGLVGIAEDGEEVELGMFAIGSVFPVVAVTDDTVTLEAGDGTRFTLRREDVVLDPC